VDAQGNSELKEVPKYLSNQSAKLAYDPRPEEGYFQGWNFYFSDPNTVIFVTFLVSNLGPGSLNNGVSLYVQHKGFGKFYITKEFAQPELQATPGKFGQKSGLNFVEKQGNEYKIEIRMEEIELDLKIQSGRYPSYPLSGGEFSLSPFPGFLRADIGFSKAPASGEIRKEGKAYPLIGVAGMEHLNTNVEVYKYSKRWEILRAYGDSQKRFYYGGFDATSNFRVPYFKKIAIVNPSGVLFEGSVTDQIVLESKKNQFSNYEIPIIQKIQFNSLKNCTAILRDGKILGQVNVLSNLSSILRWFVQLFFASPYQLHYQVEVDWDCESSGIPKETFKNGIHSYYLINR
jgi:hypothetical protein